MAMPGSGSCSSARGRVLMLAGVATTLLASQAGSANDLLAYRDQIEQGYNARDIPAIDATVAALKKAGKASGQDDIATYYAAFGRLRQSAIPGIPKDRARDYLELCIRELEPLVKRRHDHAQARALHASCLGASANYYVLRAASRGIASGREMAAALTLEPDDPWVVFQDAVSDFLTPPMFGGNKEQALDNLRRAERLFVASRPAGSSAPVFGESETWLYIGRVRLALGQREEALKALERALALAPASADVRDEIAKL